MKKELILIGGGGHCKSCIDVIEEEDKYKIVGILDKAANLGKNVLGYKVIGTDNELNEFISEGYSFLITIGQIKTFLIRKKLFEFIERNDGEFATVISPYAQVSKYATIGLGTIIMHSVNINAGVVIGKNNILNTKCDIEHDSVIGNHCHVSSNVVVNGDCSIGDNNFIGSGTVIANELIICNEIVIGAGSLVIRSIHKKGTYAGVPSKLIK